MKKSVFIILMSLFVVNTYAQDDIKYTEVKSAEISTVMAKVYSINSFGFKTHLFKTCVLNSDLGYNKDENPEGAKQFLYISDTELGKEKTTKLYKVENLINIEVLEINEVPDGYEVKLANGPPEDRIEQTFILKIAAKK